MNDQKAQLPGWQAAIIKNYLPPLLVFIGALTIRLLVTFQFNQNSPVFDYPLIDAMEYDRLARFFAENGKWGQEGAFYQPPLYPLFLAGIYKIFGYSYLWPRVIQSLLGATSCLVLYAVGCRFAGKLVGFLAGSICALYGPLIYFELELLAPVLTVLFGILGLFLLCRGLTDRKVWQFLSSGIFTGLATIAWPLTGLFACAGVISVFLHFKKHINKSILFSAAIISGVILPIAPVSLINYFKGEPVLISTNGPVTLYAANNIDWRKTALFRPGYDWEKIVTLPYRLYSEEKVTQVGKTRIYLTEIADYISTHPWHYAKAIMTKISHLVYGFEIMNPTDVYFFKNFSPVLDKLIFQYKYLKFPFGILFPFALIGILVSLRHKREGNCLLFSYLLSGAFGLIVFCVSARFRLIIIPVLAIYAGLGIRESAGALFSANKKAGALGLLSATLLGAYFLANIDIFQQESFFESPVVKSQSYFAVGHVMRKDKRYPEALSWLKKTVETDANYTDAWIELGLTKFDMGDNIGAIVAWTKAHETAPDYPLPLYNLARTYDRLRKYDLANGQKAINYYKKYLAASESYHEALLHRKDRIEFSRMRLKNLTAE